MFFSGGRSPGCFLFFVFFKNPASCSQVGNYKRAVKRFDDGHRLCNDLMGCLQERAKIEKAYGDQLTAWSKRWRQLIEKGQSPSCGGDRAGAARWLQESGQVRLDTELAFFFSTQLNTIVSF